MNNETVQMFLFLSTHYPFLAFKNSRVFTTLGLLGGAALYVLV